MCEFSLLEFYEMPVREKWYTWGPYPLLIAIAGSLVLVGVLATIAAGFIGQQYSVCVFPISILLIVVMNQSFGFLYSRLRDKQENPVSEKNDRPESNP